MTRLFCLPYAAGSVAVFHDWQLPGTEIVALEPPGRGRRFGEPLLERVEPLVDDLLPEVADRIDGPFALFGHSLGGLVAFEIAHRLQADGVKPLVLFASGIRAPHLGPLTPPASLLGDEDFRRRLRELNGTPQELLDNDELMDLMVPVLRADFSVADNYVCRPRPPLNCPVVAFGSLRDPEVDLPALRGWEEHTSARFTAHVLPGDHFFLHSHRDQLLEHVAGHLS